MHLPLASLLSLATVTHGVCQTLQEHLQRDLNGTYTIVNVASGRRLASDAKVLFATKYGAIHSNQRWRFQPEGADSFAIVNAISGMRILAQSGGDWAQGFFAVSDGPIYQDQRWRLDLQEQDGSYLIVNVRSGRRILARSGEDGGLGFAAVASNWPIHQDQMWWLINQDMDEASRWVLRLQAKHTEKVVDMMNQTVKMKAQLRSSEKAAWKLAEDLTSRKGEISDLKQKAQVERKISLKLAEQVTGLQTKNERVLLDLQTEQAARWKLADEVEVQADELTSLRVQLRSELECRSYCLPPFSFWEGLRMQVSKLLMFAIATSLGLVVLPSCRCRLKSASGRVAQSLSRLWTSRSTLQLVDTDSHALQDRHVEVGCALPFYNPRKVLAHAGGELGFDFAHQIFRVDSDQSQTCLIKIQCPGVTHDDVEIQLLVNGVDVTIHRKASCGVEEMVWKKKFTFKPSEGLYEFKEDQMRLECGFLHLYFRQYTFQRRVIRFPQHFTLDATDNDLCWEYSSEATPSELLERVVPTPPHQQPATSWFPLGDGTESTASTTPRHVV
mmetsp:Transcript_58161/g.104076  ORF Transcript_58161/g.104076 Transcript_58161/m.104076 type:complete len:556 (-) Transcript_58161:45-1712(-)